MSPEFRLTSTSWARVIKDQLYVLDYKGIKRFEPYRTPSMQPTLAQILIHDERYMDGLQEAEVDSLMADEESQDDWIAHVDWHVHRKGSCPHGTILQQEAYATAFREMRTDDCDREAFFRDRVDWNDLRAWVTDWATNSVECIASFLREHPVEAVYQQRNEEWIFIEEVLAFCPDCGEPIAELRDEYNAPVEHLWEEAGALYSPGPCAICDGNESLGENMGCLYDLEGNLRPLFCCPDCSFQFTTDDLDGTFVENYGRPATWPRDAPYPPRRGFLGEPMDVVPWED
jgi:hypothetical protein